MGKTDTATPYKVTRIYDGKSAEVRRQERHQLLLATGIRMIARDGYAAVSLNAICAEAGLTKRYFYESFDSVEGLLIAAYHQIASEVEQQVMQGISAAKTPAAMIQAGFRAFFEYLQAHPDRARVFLVEALSVQSTRGSLLGGGGGEVSPFLLATTRQFVDHDILPEPVLAVMAQGAVGAAIFVGQNWIAANFERPIEELVQGVSEICFGIGERLNVPLNGRP